jgi:hypothetical protein
MSTESGNSNMTPQDQGAGTNPLNNLVTIMQQAAIHAGFANRMSFFYLDTFAKAIRAAFEPKGIDPTQGKAQDHRAERDARIKAVLADIEGIRQGFCPCGYCGTINNGECFKCGTDWGINQEPRKAQGKESDGPEASPLQKAAERVLKAYDRMELQGGGTAEILQAIDTKLRPALNAERSDAPTPNPLETAEELIEDFIDDAQRNAFDRTTITGKSVLENLQSHGYEITRTGWREWDVKSEQWDRLRIINGESINLDTVLRVREVPGSTAGEGMP